MGITPPEGFPVAVPLEVRFKDIDCMGHVNNAVYFTYFENARIAYWKAVGLDRLRGDVAYVLVRAECDFRSQATMDDRLVCHIRVGGFGARSFRFEYVLRDENSGRVVAEGKSVQAMYDYEKKEVRPVGESLKSAISRFEGRDLRTPESG